ncbi:MAG TPA: hypothetical protein VL356_04950 [Acidocella sp.]|jgi:hypothetical protein|nr:hypothetical protein [Acidocella sp.]
MADRAAQRQSAFNLPVLRKVVIDDEPGRVILKVMDQHTQAELMRLEFSPDEADAVARHFWSASSCASVPREAANV